MKLFKASAKTRQLATVELNASVLLSELQHHAERAARSADACKYSLDKKDITQALEALSAFKTAISKTQALVAQQDQGEVDSTISALLPPLRKGVGDWKQLVEGTWSEYNKVRFALKGTEAQASLLATCLSSLIIGMEGPPAEPKASAKLALCTRLLGELRALLQNSMAQEQALSLQECSERLSGMEEALRASGEWLREGAEQAAEGELLDLISDLKSNVELLVQSRERALRVDSARQALIGGLLAKIGTASAQRNERLRQLGEEAAVAINRAEHLLVIGAGREVSKTERVVLLDKRTEPLITA